MKKIIFLLLCFIISVVTVNAQKGINFNRSIATGGKLLMYVDSGTKNIFYAIKFPNQPNTAFNYLPEVNNISLEINFRKSINIQNYRYTILVDDKPIAVNKAINQAQLTDTHAGGDEEIFKSTSIGNFSIKGKVITVLTYSIEKPLDIDKAVFYAKPIPKAKIKALGKRFTVEKGVDYSYITDPKEQINLNLTTKDDELTIVKDRTDIDYIYYTSIKDKATNKIIFESTAWQYGGYMDETNQLSPYLNFDKSIFKKSGDYEVIIQPQIKWTKCFDCNVSTKEIESYTARYTLSVILEEESFSKKEVWTYIGYTCSFLGLISGLIMVFIKRKNAEKLSIAKQKKEIAQLQLNSVRSQLNPHFLFNALAGIQNLMNKNEPENANKYLTKFARLTRNVLDSKELLSLTEEHALLDDYLQMEQLRFGFQYQIIASIDLDTQNIELPAMLLQPFVENAVKHGIADKTNEGKIYINFEQRGNNLELSISDNGKGFDSKKKYEGLGLTLSENRISLLNTVYPANTFVLKIKSDGNGTEVKITLNQWL